MISKKQEDGSYEGTYTFVEDELWYTECGNCPKIDVICRHEDEIVMMIINPNRIEGKAAGIPYPDKKRAQIKYIKTCGDSEKKNRRWGGASYGFVQTN